MTLAESRWPDGPRGLPLLGSAIPFFRDPPGFLLSLRRDFGPLARFRVPGYTLCSVADPELVDVVLRQRADIMHKDAIYDLLRPILGQGLLTSEGQVWRRSRKLAAPSFTPRHVATYAAVMRDEVERYVHALGRGGERELHEDMMGLTQRVVLRTLFGSDLDVDVSPAGHAVEVVMEEFVTEAHRLRRLLPRSVPTPGRLRQRRAMRALDDVLSEIVAARRERGLGDDLLSRLLAARDEDGQGFSDQQLRDEAVTLFVAGHETTALALTFTLMLLSEHPDAERRAAEEVAAARAQGQPPESAHSELRWLRCCLDEAMRLYPPAWAMGRENQAPLELGGYRLPSGTQLVVSPWVIHRDPRFYEDPEAFRPERWLEPTRALPRHAYLPFGGGPRVCIGNHFALLEAAVLLAGILERFRVVLTGGRRPTLMPSITLRPAEPVRCRFEARVG